MKKKKKMKTKSFFLYKLVFFFLNIFILPKLETIFFAIYYHYLHLSLHHRYEFLKFLVPNLL